LKQLKRNALLAGVIATLTSLAFATSGIAHAGLVSIDFSGLAVADIVTNQFSEVAISLLDSAPIAGPRIYALEDTSGNPVDVLGASGNAITPGDNVGSCCAPFHDMQFSFPGPVDFFEIQVLDAEERVVGKAYLGDTLVQSVQQGTFLGFHSGSVFNGPVYRLTLGSLDGPIRFDRVVIDVTENDGPELYDNVSFNTVVVPEPSSAFSILVLLFALALGGIWRAKSSAR
jgi:hypothetical protein